MTFDDPFYLYAIPVVLALLLVLFGYSGKMRNRFLRKMIAFRLQERLTRTFSPRRKRFKNILIFLSIGLLLFSLARPQFGHTWEEQYAKGIDVLFMLDTSNSMLAEDIRPNRLERAKYAITDLVRKLHGDRIGLLAFAGGAFLQCPLTLDYDAFRQTLEATDTKAIQKGGTDMATAIQTAQKSFPLENNFKFIILITDGEDLSEEGIAQARLAAKEDVTIYTVGVGSKQGELIPIKKADGTTDYMRDENGKVVKTKLDEETLSKIASATGGFYVPLGATGEGLDRVYQAGLNTIPKQELSSALRKVPVEQFQIPLAIAILFLLSEPLISTRKEVLVLRRRFKKMFKKAALILVPLLIILPNENSLEASIATDAYKAYVKKDFKKAAELFNQARNEDLHDNELPYNLGTSHYQAGNFDAAVHALNDTLAFQNIEIQQDALYNLGNANYRLGQESLNSNPQQTIELWEQALEHYLSAIDLDDSDIEAQENYDFVKKKLEDLKQQEHQKENEEKENEEKEEQEKKDKEKKDKENRQDQEDKQDDSKEDKPKDQDDNGNDGDQDKEKKNQPQDEDQKNASNKDSGSEQQRPQQSQPKEKPASANSSPQKITKDEARQLLRALQNSEKKLPALNQDKDGDIAVIQDNRNW